MARHGLTAGQVVDAKKVRFEAARMPELLQGVMHLAVMRRTSVAHIFPQNFRGGVPEEVCEQMLGPSGNLRAPSLRAGSLLLVGFIESEWRTALNIARPGGRPD
jgi:hypothetical protein